MSRVTNVILVASVGEDREYLKQTLTNIDFEGLNISLVSIDDERLPGKWYGGTKKMEALMFLGAFNYIDLDKFVRYLKENVNWVSIELVQLIVKQQLEVRFSIIELCPLEY